MHMSVQLYNYSKRARSCRCTASGPSDAAGGGRGLPSAGWVSLAPPTASCLTGGGVVIRTRLAVGVSGSESEVGAGGGEPRSLRRLCCVRRGEPGSPGWSGPGEGARTRGHKPRLLGRLDLIVLISKAQSTFRRGSLNLDHGWSGGVQLHLDGVRVRWCG